MKHKKIRFPRRFKHLVYAKEVVTTASNPSKNRFAIYKGIGRLRFLAKMSTAKVKSRGARKIQIEAKYLEVLTNVASRIRTQIKDNTLPIVNLPSYKGLYIDGEKTILFTNYLYGSTLGKINNLKHRTVYFKVNQLMKKLDQNMSQKEKRYFPQRNGIYFVIHYPIFLIKAICLNINIWREIIRGLPVFLSGLPYLLKLGNRTVLSHGDLHGASIVKHKDKFTLINPENMIMTMPEYDILCALAANWHDRAFQQMVFEELKISLGRPSYNHPYVLVLMVYIATLYLSSNKYSDRHKVYYRGVLAYAVTHSILPDPRTFSWFKKLFYIVPSYLHSTIIYASGKKRTMKLPDSIGEYQKVFAINTTKRYPYALGLYRANSGIEVVAKIWQGNRYSAHAFNLLHEADVCRVLETIRLRVVSELPEALSAIITPSYHDCVIDNGVIALFMSKAQGESITNKVSPDEQLRIYNLVVSYIKFLGKQATPEERKVIGEKGIFYYAAIFPIIFCLAVIRHFSQGLEIIRGLYSFVFSLFSLYDEPKVLSHGDLHTDNILLKDGKITLIDLEQTCFTYSGFDAFTTVSNTRSLPEFRLFIEKDIWEDGKKSSHDASSLSGIGTFISLFNLTNNLSSEYVKHFSSILKISNTLSVLWEHSPEMRLKSLRFPSFWGKKTS